MRRIVGGLLLVSWLSFCFDGRADTVVVPWGDRTYEGSGPPPNLVDATSISAGYYHTYAIRENGTVAAWGLYPGRDGVSWFPVPPPPPSVTNVVSVAAGAYYFTLALRADGTVVSWVPPGYSAGPDTTSWTNIVSMVAYFESALVARADGTVSTYKYASPPAGLKDVVAVSLGSLSALALKRDGSVVAWGGPTNIPPGLTNVVAISSGGFHAALKTDGAVLCWNAIETFVPQGVTNALAIDIGDAHGLALLRDGTVAGWQWPGSMPATKPQVVPAGLRNVASISAHFSKSLAVVRLPLPLQGGTPGIRLSYNTLVYSNAGPDQIVSPNETVLSSQGLQGMYGWTFRLEEPVSAVGIGWLDDGTNGLAQPHQVGLWKDEPGLSSLPYVAGSNLTLVASAMLGAGTNTTLDTIWRRVDFATNVTLTRGSYVLAGSYDGTIPEVVRYVQESSGSSVLSNSIDRRIGLGSPAVGIGGFAPPGVFVAIQAAELGPMIFLEPATGTNGSSPPEFANLDFEMADLPLPPDPTELSYPASLALPSWSVNKGGVLYNAPTLDDSTVGVLHSNALSGKFSAFVQFQGDWQGEPGAFWQEGQIPASARSLRFTTSALRRDWTELRVLVNGEPLKLSPTRSGADFMDWVADISSVAGSQVELRFTARTLFGSSPGVPATAIYGTVVFDDIQFSELPAQPLIRNVSPAQYVVRGGTATLRVEPEGSGPLAFAWHHKGDLIAGATAETLVLTNVDYADAGGYSVTVSGPSGSLTSETQISVSSVAFWGGNPLYATFDPPPQPPALTNVIGIGAGESFGAAITEDGLPHMWTPGSTEVSFPFWVNDAIAASAGVHVGMVLRENGDVYLRDRYSLTLSDKSANSREIVAISAGDYHYLGLTARGTAVLWLDTSFRRGYVPPGLDRLVAVAAGGAHSLALRDDGTVVAWGDNSKGQTNVPPGLSGAVGIAAGSDFSLALLDDGTVVGWGAAPTPPSDLRNVVRIAAGRAHALALRGDGTVVSWGSETNVPAGLRNVVAISTRVDYSLALVGDGPPVRHVRLEQPMFTPQGVAISFPTTSGRVYRVEYRDGWSDVWHPLPLVAGNGRVRSAAQPWSDSATRFYRVREW